jgi:hypothetical protein
MSTPKKKYAGPKVIKAVINRANPIHLKSMRQQITKRMASLGLAKKRVQTEKQKEAFSKARAAKASSIAGTVPKKIKGPKSYARFGKEMAESLPELV